MTRSTLLSDFQTVSGNEGISSKTLKAQDIFLQIIPGKFISTLITYNIHTTITFILRFNSITQWLKEERKAFEKFFLFIKSIYL
jgi:hypothetical protein